LFADFVAPVRRGQRRDNALLKLRALLPGGGSRDGCMEYVEAFSEDPMCRSIKTLFNFEPPASDAEIRAAALQFVRKLSGTSGPSKMNEEAFNRAVEEVTETARRLVDSLVTTAPPRNRDVEALKAKLRSAKRFEPR
jgi:hypothetical protein